MITRAEKGGEFVLSHFSDPHHGREVKGPSSQNVRYLVERPQKSLQTWMFDHPRWDDSALREVRAFVGGSVIFRREQIKCKLMQWKSSETPDTSIRRKWEDCVSMEQSFESRGHTWIERDWQVK